MSSGAEAVEALMNLGLAEYEARCFVALTELSRGTAKEISRLADVPQSRVYDVTEQLHRKGLLDVQESDPREYSAVPVETAVERLRHEYDEHLAVADEALRPLEGRESDPDGVWKVAAGPDVVHRMTDHVREAEREVYLHATSEELLEPTLTDALADASDRDVSVLVEVPSETARERVHENVPEAEAAVTDLASGDFGDEPQTPGRLLMVDRETVLVSALRSGAVAGGVQETGIWSSTVGHGLVVWLRQFLVPRLERAEFRTAEE